MPQFWLLLFVRAESEANNFLPINTDHVMIISASQILVIRKACFEYQIGETLRPSGCIPCNGFHSS